MLTFVRIRSLHNLIVFTEFSCPPLYIIIIISCRYEVTLVSVSGGFFVSLSLFHYLSSLFSAPLRFRFAPLTAGLSICSGTNINYYFITPRVYARIHFNEYYECVRECAPRLRWGVADEAYVTNAAAAANDT